MKRTVAPNYRVLLEQQVGMMVPRSRMEFSALLRAALENVDADHRERATTDSRLRVKCSCSEWWPCPVAEAELRNLWEAVK